MLMGRQNIKIANKSRRMQSIKNIKYNNAIETIVNHTKCCYLFPCLRSLFFAAVWPFLDVKDLFSSEKLIEFREKSGHYYLSSKS